ncbi:helix-turn-helix transcriptional regulator [Emticicia sp. 21SJ11W-3]|uniref:ArsR/SmtB family transcription factor n=1 Tax=Emticicia sp. 21SJ11W-3 TaxID=2916755 RepID=UPI00209CDB1A|nr:winged helix-turn-helix domain-containing protein [Emticicia sp. 21SJ11W-3]UTA66438.1 winged helix-turn-helix domain-containing protein [Emticicia sp. 21SJ11W-3]
MTYAKTSLFDVQQQEIAQIAKALSHPARVAIIQFLAKKQVCVSGDISNELPLSRTTVSQHLQELKELGIIQGEVSGQHVCYCLDIQVVARVKTLFQLFFESALANPQAECC